MGISIFLNQQKKSKPYGVSMLLSAFGRSAGFSEIREAAGDELRVMLLVSSRARTKIGDFLTSH